MHPNMAGQVKSSPLRRLFLGGGPPFEELPSRLVLRLYEKFTPEVEELEALPNRDLSAWKSPGSRCRGKMDEVAQAHLNFSPI